MSTGIYGPFESATRQIWRWSVAAAIACFGAGLAIGYVWGWSAGHGL